MTITRQQYHQLLGLRVLADQHYKAIATIDQAVLSITKEESEYGHSSDYIAGSRDLDELLRLLNITIQDTP